MPIDLDQSKAVAQEMVRILKKNPGIEMDLKMCLEVADPRTQTGVAGKRYLLSKAGLCRPNGKEVKSLPDGDWEDAWKTLRRFGKDGIVELPNHPLVFKYDPTKEVKQVHELTKATPELRAQLAEALIELVQAEGVISKDEARDKICQRFGYSGFKHPIWAHIVKRAIGGDVSGRNILIDNKENIYLRPDLLDSAEEVAKEAAEVAEVVTKEVAPQISVSSTPEGLIKIILDDGTEIIRDSKTKEIKVKAPGKGWKVVISQILSLLS